VAESITITDNRTGQSVEVPIVDGGVAATAWSKLLPGVWFYDPAFMSTAACQSAVTYLDGEAGILRYRGYPIEQLAEQSNYLEVAYLLINGELPTADEFAAWSHEITYHTFIHENVRKRFLEGFNYDAHPMGMLVSAIAALSICYGAYLAEIFRAGLQSIPKGQMEAALALGLSRTQALWRVILPQTIRVILPPIGNEFIALLKDSSLVSILAVSDLLRRGREYASTTFDYLEAYTVVALIYLIMTLFFSRLVGLLEERMRTHGRQHH